MNNAITNDKWVSFFLKNFEEIQGLMELATYSQQKLREILAGKICDIIREECQEIFREKQMVSGHDKHEIWWYHPAYYNENSDQCSGIYCGFPRYIESLDFFELESNKGAYFFIFHFPLGTTKSAISANHKAVAEGFSKAIKKQGVPFFEFQQSFLANQKDYVLYYYLSREIAIDTLRDATKFKESIVNAVTTITDLYLNVLKGIKLKGIKLA
jgi:hypothetical protein